ncbi:MAG: hypothetical protein V4501_09920 [Pseudomonadota bacterium]
MRSFLLSIRPTFLPIVIVSITIILAFSIAAIFNMFFDVHQLEANTELSSAVYQVLGTVYAILLTFTLWGVWQNFNEATDSAQNEASALVDLVHIVEASGSWKEIKIREASLSYLQLVVDKEWPVLQNITNDFLNMSEKTHSSSVNIVRVVQSIVPQNPREVAIFSQSLTLLNSWLDARRKRILIARGDSAKSLWPLLITGAFVLFAFHGLFVAKTVGIWASLLFGFSLTIGLTFYLIFSLDCPFAGTLSIDSEPFQLAINILKSQKSSVDVTKL